MKKFISGMLPAVESLVITLWVGSLWTTGLLVAPVLFTMLDDRTVAGNIAGRLFEITATVAIVSAILVLVLRLVAHWSQMLREPLVWLVITMLIAALIGQFGIHPMVAQLRDQLFLQPVMETELRAQFAMWHAIAEIVYLVQCLLGAALVIIFRRERA